MPTRRTDKPSSKQRTGIDRLYRYNGARKVSFYYQYPNGSSETLATADAADRSAIKEAEVIAKRKALDIQQGKIIAGSVAELIDRFRTEEDKKHYRDQSRDGIAVRKGTYANLTKFFGKMHPQSLKTIHGYQYVEDRAKQGAPVKAWKELYTFSTICKKAIRWGVMEANPFMDMDTDAHDKDVRTVSRSQVVRFYLWSQRQNHRGFKNLGCAALFTYLTGFRAAEVRPFHVNGSNSGITSDGVWVMSAKRKKGEDPIKKMREWSPRLRMAVARARQSHKVARLYLFANRHGQPYTRSGWGSVWQDAMAAWIGQTENLVEHPDYFSLLDVRPTAITKKLANRDADAYDFAAHANPATTHRHYDRRKIKRASATE